MRRLAHGVTAGVLLSCLRAPLGLDWTQLAAVQGTTAALFRAAALLALALSLDPARAALREGARPAWLAALCAGYVLHGLVLDVTPESRAGYALALVAGTLILRALAGARSAAPEAARPEELGRRERIGLVVIGLGAAVALETLAHQVRLLTLATRADETVVGGVFLALLALGAVAFGPLVARLGSERTRFAAGVGLAAAGAMGGLLFVSVLTPDGLHGYLRRFDVFLGWLRALDARLGGPLGLAGVPTLDGASIGTLWTTAILSSAALLAPGFTLGATLGSTRHVGRLAHVLVGGAIGLVLLPSVVRLRAEPLTFEQVLQASFAWDLLVAGASTAALGVAVAASAAPARARGLALALAVALVPWVRPRLVVWSFSPWSPSPVAPALTLPTGEGILTVERARGSASVVTLDRRRLTPTSEEEEADERRLRLAWSLLPSELVQARGAEPVRALFVGQLTPPRARVLASLGALDLERTAAWHAAMPAVEELLFRGQAPPPGRIVAPATARAKLDDGEYDWVVAAPFHGPIVTWKSEARAMWAAAEPPRLVDLELGDETAGVAWLDANSLAPRGASLDALVLSIDHLESFSLGLVRGAAAAGAGAGSGPLFAVEDVRGPGPWRFLCTMPQQRSFELERAWATSLTSAAAPDLARGLALHFSAQVLSSPYETRAQQIEVDEDALRAFFAAVPKAGPPDGLTRELWEALAWLLTEKRMPEQALVYLEPVAEAFAPWAALDRAVARAYREVLEPQSAMRYLERARGVLPQDVELLLESARASEELGDLPRALVFLEEARAVAPGRADVERALALALLRAGDARGRPMVERLLAERPDDAELQRALEASPPVPDSGGR